MRHPWLQINLLTAFLAGFVVSLFEGTISQVVVLAAFLPILAGQCGNTGCQALAITLRGLTLGDLQDYPVRKLLFKELLLGAITEIGSASCRARVCKSVCISVVAGTLTKKTNIIK